MNPTFKMWEKRLTGIGRGLASFGKSILGDSTEQAKGYGPIGKFFLGLANAIGFIILAPLAGALWVIAKALEYFPLTAAIVALCWWGNLEYLDRQRVKTPIATAEFVADKRAFLGDAYCFDARIKQRVETGRPVYQWDVFRALKKCEGVTAPISQGEIAKQKSEILDVLGK